MTKPWDISVELLQTQPYSFEIKNPSTYTELGWNYKLDEKNSINATLSFSQRWQSEFHEEQFRIDDVFLGLTRSDLVTLSLYLGLPTSHSSQIEKRDFSLSIEPMFTVENKSWWLHVKAEFLVSINQNTESISRLAKNDVESHYLWSQIYLNYRFNEQWSITSRFSHQHSVTYLNDIKEIRTLYFGPAYRFNQNTSLRMQFYSEETTESYHSLLETQASGVKLSFRFKI